MNVEQMVRDLLDQAIKDRLVTFRRTNFVSTTCPQELTSGDLVGTANLLATMFREFSVHRDDRWQLAVGMPLEAAEELAKGIKP